MTSLAPSSVTEKKDVTPAVAPTPKTTEKSKTPKSKTPKSRKPQGLLRGIAGVADTMTGGVFDFDKRGSNKIQRVQQGIADFLTFGMFDFDKKNPKGSPKGFGIKRIMGGVADWATMGLTDFDFSK